MKIRLLFLSVACALFLSSCATIFKGSSQNVKINSSPSGAIIEVNGIEKGTTSSTIKLKKGFSGQTVTLKKDGYEDKSFIPDTSFDYIGLLNILFPLGFVIDAATGSMMKYDQKTYNMSLKSVEKQP